MPPFAVRACGQGHWRAVKVRSRSNSSLDESPCLDSRPGPVNSGPSVVPSDRDHVAAVRWRNQNTQPFIPTAYVVDETLTLLKARGQALRALRLGEQCCHGALATVSYLTEADILQSWQLFRQYADHGWSFTDGPSKVLIDTRRLTQAFACDHPFHHCGSIEVVP